MSLFTEIVNEAMSLNEEFSGLDNIRKAIRNALRVRMTYNDKQGGRGKNERYILPVAYGKTKKGNNAVRAYETAGSSKRGLTPPVPGNPWKLFLTDNIVSWSNGKRSFKELRDKLIQSGFNINGDKGMTEIYEISPLANGNVSLKADDKPINTTPVTRTELSNTNISQSPQKADDQDYVKATDKNTKTVDNLSDRSYLKNKMMAKNTNPVEKGEISQQPEEPSEKPSDQTLQSTSNNPVTKQEIDVTDNGNETETTSNDIKDNPITKSYNDMMNRMSKLYSDEEENNNEKEEEV